MALLDILVYPDPRLRNKALPVEAVDATIAELVEDMAETMYTAPGIGLAATQVNVAKRIVVIDTSEHQDRLQVFINPVLEGMGELVETEEGCLSVPAVVVPVKRHAEVHISALDKDGKPFEHQATGLLAVCIQHEVDHLDGKVFVDYLSQLKRDRIRKQLLREERSSGKSFDKRKEPVTAS